MLNRQQIDILGYFYSNNKKFVTANEISEKFNISRRTAQKDITVIKQDVLQEKIGVMGSFTSKGTKLSVTDNKKFEKLYLLKSKQQDLSDRVRQLSFILIKSHKNLSKSNLERRLYVSSSTLTGDLNRCSKIFKTFNLNLTRNPGGIKLTGLERDKRECVIQLGLWENNLQGQVPEYLHNNVEKIVVDTLLKNHYNVSENLFQDLLVHIEVAVDRIQNGFFIEKRIIEKEDNFDKEYQIAQEIFKSLCQKFNLKMKNNEILELSIRLHGIVSDESNQVISDFVEQLMDISLEKIKSEFNIDFTQNFELKYSLSLHIMSLIIRVRYDIQNDNKLLDEIKRSFPLAFDIAVFVGLILQKKLNHKIIEGEIAYLAIYFNQYLAKNQNIKSTSRILIITSLKKSETVLLRQRFAMWFPESIQTLNTVTIDQLSKIDVESYDVIFSTEKSSYLDQIGAILISYYPKESEYSKIRLAIDGFKSKDQILDLFSPDRFYVGKFKNKDEVLKKLFEMSSKIAGPQSSKLNQAVQTREKLGSSYFGNYIALPHPVSPLPLQTFVSVVLTQDDLDWDEDNDKVRLIMLFAMERNNAKAFKIWNYFGKIIKNKDFVDQLIEKPNFNNFRNKLSELL